MTPERELQLRKNIFEMWFELLRISCKSAGDIEFDGSSKLLSSNYKILEESKEVLKNNFIKHYYISKEIKEKDDENLQKTLS